MCYCLESPELPLKGNSKPNDYKIYYRDTGLLIASLDEEAEIDSVSTASFTHSLIFVLSCLNDI